MKEFIRKILVPLDGSKSSLKGFDMALTITKMCKAEIIGVHVIHLPFISKSDLSNKMLQQFLKKADKIFIKTMKRVKGKKQHVKKKILFGDNIGRTLTTFAQKNRCDLIIIGSRGTAPHLDMFLGSVSNYLLMKAKMPVLLVK